MKKVLSMMMALLLLVGVMAFVASATGADATLTIETTGTHNWIFDEDEEEWVALDTAEAVKPGDTVILAVKLTKVKLASYQLTIKYDTNKMTLVNIYEGDKILGTFVAKPETGTIVDFTTADKNLNGNIMYLEFEVADDVAGLLEVTAEIKGFYKADQSALTVEVVSGGITIAHDCQWGEGAVTTPATCTEDGVKTYTCSICGETKTEAIPATGHTYDAGVVTTPATCTAEGVMTYTCACGHTKTEKIAKIAHTEVEIPAVAPSCTETGLTAGKKCSVCGTVTAAQTEVPATGHTYDAGVVTTPATCTAEGVMTYTCACGHTKTEKIAKIAHTEVVDAAVAPTCTTEGKTEGKHCSVCNTVLVAQETIAKLAHTYTEEVTKAPTCTEKGEKKLTCACGDVKTEEIAVVAHTEVVDAAVAPTCTEAGKTAGKHCSVCNTVIVAQDVVPATGHTEVVDAAVAATCTTAGKTEGKHCSVCETVLVAQEEVAATGHNDADHNHKCDACEEVLSECADADNDSVCDICGATVTPPPKTGDVIAVVAAVAFVAAMSIVALPKAKKF